MQYNGNQDYLEKVAARSLAQMLYPAWEKAKGLGSSLGQSVGKRFRRGAKSVADATGVTDAMTGAPYQVVSDNLPSARRAKALQEFSDLANPQRKQLPLPTAGVETGDAISSRQALLQQLHDADIEAAKARVASAPQASEATARGILEPITDIAPERDPELAKRLQTIISSEGSLDDSLFKLYSSKPWERTTMLQKLKMRGDAARRALEQLPPQWQDRVVEPRAGVFPGSIFGNLTWSPETFGNWDTWAKALAKKNPDFTYLLGVGQPPTW